jgi:hypothetical protein
MIAVNRIMSDIFISYAREDIDKVRPFVKLIEDNGWTVFWDTMIPPGLTWREYIGKALSNAKCVIVVWSRNSVKSLFVQEEADEACERKVLIPIKIDDSRPPLGFRAIQHEDFTNWKGESNYRSAKNLIKAIEGIAGKPQKGRVEFTGKFTVEQDKSPKDDNWEKRVLCSDGNCIGVLGPDGHCKICGKAIETDEDLPSVEVDWEKRVLCSDGSCIGVIGPSGRCKICGKIANVE